MTCLETNRWEKLISRGYANWSEDDRAFVSRIAHTELRVREWLKGAGKRKTPATLALLLPTKPVAAKRPSGMPFPKKKR